MHRKAYWLPPREHGVFGHLFEDRPPFLGEMLRPPGSFTHLASGVSLKLLQLLALGAVLAVGFVQGAPYEVSGARALLARFLNTSRPVLLVTAPARCLWGRLFRRRRVAPVSLVACLRHRQATQRKSSQAGPNTSHFLEN